MFKILLSLLLMSTLTKFCVKFIMSRDAFHKLKIFNSVIISNIINMMNTFFFGKITSKVFLHNQSMLLNTSFFISKRMPYCLLIDIISEMRSRINSYKIIFSKVLNVFFGMFLTLVRFTQIFKPFFAERLSLFTKMSKSNFYLMFFRLRTTFSKIAFPNIRTFSRATFSSLKSFNSSIEYFFTNNTRLIHTFSLFFVIITFNVIGCLQSFATDEWRNSTGALTVLGSSQASDLDTNIYNNIVSPLDRLLANYREGMNITYNSAAQFTVTAGSVVCSNSDGSIRKMRLNTTSTTVTWANIDTGAEASGTTYYVYANCDATATTAAFKISASSTSPSGVTSYKRLGSFINDGSSNITTIINDNSPSYFGVSASKSAGTVYQALTDGFVCGDATATSIANISIDIYNDNSNPPTTIVRSNKDGNASGTNILTACNPVMKGSYYKVVLTSVSVQNNISFYPVGQ